MQFLLLLVAALAVTVALMPALVRLAPYVGLVDQPGGRKTHVTPTPRVGGVALVVGTLSALLLMAEQPTSWLYVYAGGLLLLGIGLWDDCVNLRWPLKLAAQIAACTLAVTFGDVRIESLTLVERIELPQVVAVPLSIVFLVGVTNAINMTDGLDGLAGGTTLLVVIAIGWLAYQADDIAVATVAAALVGALLGFLRFNTHPARVFMGDSGSQFLGYMVVIVAIKSTQGADKAVSAALPLILLAWPIIDTLQVSLQRIAAGQSPFVADRRHLHHRLLGLGFDHYQSVIVIYAVHAVLFLTAYFLRFESDVTIATVFALATGSILGGLHLAQRAGLRIERPEGSASAIASQLAWARDANRLPRWIPRIIALLVASYAWFVCVSTTDLTSDLILLVAAIGALQVILLMLRGSTRAAGLQRLPAYLMVTLLVYLDQRWRVADDSHGVVIGILFFALATCVILQFRLSETRRGQFTPLDALVVLVVLLVPLLLSRLISDASVAAIGILKIVLLLYALEFLAARPRLETAIGLVVVGVSLTQCALSL